MKPKLIILSDIFGKRNSDWIVNYTDVLENHFDIKFYDCCQLGEIDTSNFNETVLHQQFVNGGISKAIENLCRLETETSIILGFSIGGYIAWKAALNTLRTNHIFAISSTRLRFETKKPSANITLLFGENDPYKPTEDWFTILDIKPQFLNNERHDFYKNPVSAKRLCNEIMLQITK